MSETTTRERPILFSAPMVRALLDGTKTQTRRVVKPQGIEVVDGVPRFMPYQHAEPDPIGVPCPYGAPGDRLWVREAYHACPHCADPDYRPWGRPEYRADHDERPLSPKCAAHGWSPSIHMPRWASRLTLAVTDVRVERLQDISEGDATAEGVEYEWHGVPVGAVENYRALWDSLNATRGYGWDVNPWVWVVSFVRVTP